MKHITDIIESISEFNPSIKYHKDSYNSFIKWYDKQLNHLDKHELLDMLKRICSEIENDSLDTIK